VALYRFKKNKLWLWKAYSRNGELVDWEIGARDSATFEKLYNRLMKLNVNHFFTDGWRGFAEIIDRRMLTQTKKETWGIENNNGRQRHWFARFRRKTCVVSRCAKMVDLTTFLFAHFHCNNPRYVLENMFNLSS